MSAPSPAGRAHLYLASPEEWAGGAGLDRCLGLLSSDEKARYERFRVAAPARAFVTGRALARRALAFHGGVPARDWRLQPDEHGRPRILAPAADRPLEFNLSHNDRLVVCLVTDGRACGVDVEALARRVDPVRIAEHSFGEFEVEELLRLAGRDRTCRFFTYWTLKEAYLKARGRGIAMRMDSAVFRFPSDELGERIAVDFAPRVGDRAERWQFALFRVAGEQLLAVALRKHRGEPDLELRAFEARPDELRAAAAGLEPLIASRPSEPAR